MSMTIGGTLAGVSFDYGSGLYIQQAKVGCTTRSFRSGRTGEGRLGTNGRLLAQALEGDAEEFLHGHVLTLLDG